MTYRDTWRRPREDRDRDRDWSYAVTGQGTLGATKSWKRPYKIPQRVFSWNVPADALISDFRPPEV